MDLKLVCNKLTQYRNWLHMDNFVVKLLIPAIQRSDSLIALWTQCVIALWVFSLMREYSCRL